MIYHLPRLSGFDVGIVRSPGPGLGNLLLPIARALLAARDGGGIFVRPTIRQIKLGAFLRGEADKRTYGMLFRHRTLAEWAVWIRARTARKWSEGALPQASGDATIVHAGLGRYFHDLGTDPRPMRTWLDTYARYDGLVQAEYDIALHVRMGDFAAGEGVNTRIPLEWYADAIERARRLVDVAAPAVMLFSDGTAEELRPLTDRFAFTPDPAQNALTSIRNMSRGRMLIASRSTFSMWGAFLGGRPTIWDSTFDRKRFFPHRPDLDSDL